MRSPASISFRELAATKVAARIDDMNEWLEDDLNFRKATLVTTGSLVTLAAGLETAAHRVREREGTKAAIGRVGLHLAAGVAAAAAGFGLEIDGYTAGQMQNK